LEAGIPNTVGLAGLNAALDEVDPQTTLAHERALLDRLTQSVADDKRIRIIGDPSAARRVGVLSLLVRDLSPVDVAAILDESFGIAVRAGLHCAPHAHRALGTFPDGTVRVSLSRFTTAEEIDRFTTALREIAG
jgi:selenocysteine lyase/cysteine desulfurase